MLDLIRNNTQSLGVKIAFGIIILVFVFWGLGSVQSMNNPTTVATVNGQAITVMDFERAYQQARENIRQQNPQLTPEQIKEMQIPQQVLQQLIITSLLKEEVKRLQLDVSPQALREAIFSMQVFHDANGKFDAARYKSLVESQFLGAGNFEAMVSEELAQTQLRQDLTLTAKGFPSETAAFFGYTYETRDIEYVFFPTSDFMAQVPAPAEDAVKAYYESNRAAFTVPATMDLAYVSVYPKNLVKADAITAEAVQAYYDANKDDYAVRKAAKARHILIRLAEDASEADVQAATEKMQGLLTQIKDGADFATLAKDNSEDTMSAVDGGNLDWVAAGDTVQPFNDALAVMKEGDVSDIVRTQFGLHIIKVDELRDASFTPVAEVEGAIRDTLAEEAGLGKIREVVDSLIEANVLGKDLAEAAKAQGLELKNSGLKTATELQSLLALTTEQGASLFKAVEGVPLDTALSTTDKGYIIARVAKKVDAAALPFEEVKAEIIATLTKEAALNEAVSVATAARKDFDTTAPATENIKLVEKTMRGQPMGELGNVPELGTALFAANEGQWLTEAYPVSIDGVDGAVLARVTRVGAGDDEAWKPMEGILAQALVNQRQEKMFQLYLFALSEKAQVEVVNQAYLDALMAQ